MAESRHLSSILRTKLYPPPKVADMVIREDLVSLFEAGIELPLALVSAPAGYGKSTVVSHWLSSSTRPSAWISLASSEDEPRIFFDYFLAAVRSLRPEACRASIDLLKRPELPASETLGAHLVNDLDAIREPFVLVLDDFHCIENLEILGIVDLIVSQAPRSLHLVIISRRDPLISLARYRAHHQVHEVRMPELRFELAHTQSFLAESRTSGLSSSEIQKLHSATEGWPVALRLFSSALDRRMSLGKLVEGVRADGADAHEFLANEILSQQPDEVRHWLRGISILEWFSAPLVEVVAPRQSSISKEMTGEQIIQRLIEMGLPLVSLDDSRTTWRYHHILRAHLQRELETKATARERADLHVRAAQWYEGQALYAEALCHWIGAGDERGAADLVLRQRDRLQGHEQWYLLDRWLSWLPKSVIEADPELLLLEVWSSEHRGRYIRTLRLFERAHALVVEMPKGPRRDRLGMEIGVIEAGRDYQMGDFAAALERAERARRELPKESQWVRVFATRAEALCRQALGDLNGAYQVVDSWLDSGVGVDEMVRGHLLGTRGLLQWIAADRAGLERTGRALLTFPWQRELPETRAMGSYLLGAALYHANRLDEAEEILEPIATDPAAASIANQLRAVYALASIYDVRGRFDASDELLDNAGEVLHRIGTTTFLPEIDAFRAQLHVKRGLISPALQWANTFEPVFASAGYSFFLPELTAARTWLASGSAEDLAKASKLLEQEIGRLERGHCVRFLLESLALRALVRNAAGDDAAARKDLSKALALAQPGGYIHLFADLGHEAIPLLNSIEVDAESARFIGEILGAFPQATQESVLEPLSKREIEILEHVARRLTNRKIGNRLHIAEGTVKRHTQNIFAKLGVSSRWHAVEKARALGLLPPDSSR